MNLTTLAHLVRRIRALLRQQEAETQGPQLAQEFAAVCQSIVQRLAQCEAMLNQGNEHQALQQAESPPALMDVLLRVGFRELGQWRAHCQARGYPVPPPIDAGVIRRLNEAYAKGIGTDHPLYADYRGSVLTGDDNGALAALRLIVQLNPADHQMQRELEQREEAILKETLRELAEALAGGDPGAVLRRLEDIETLNLARRPAGAVWQQGQYVRVKLKLETLPAHREAQDWSGTFTILGEIKALCAEHELVLAEPDADVIRKAEAWAAGEQRAYEESQLHEKTVGELAHLIDQCEQKRLSLQELSLRTLSVQAEALERKWRELERFDRPVPQELEDRLDKALELLGVELRVKGRRRRNLLLVSAAVVVLLGLMGGMWLVRQRAIRDTAADLAHGISSRQAAAVSNLLARIGPEQPGLTNSPALKQAIAQAILWLDEERQKVVAAERSVTDLAQRFGELSPDSALTDEDWRSWQQSMTEATRTVDGVAPDWAKPLRTRLDAVLDGWDRLLAANQRVRDDAFRNALGSAREAGQTLDYSKGPGAVAGIIETLRPRLAALRAATNVPLPQLNLDPVALKEFEGLSLRIDAFSGEIAAWHDATNRVDAATTVEAYLEALGWYATNQFCPPANRPLVEAVLQTNLATARLLQSLLLPTEPEAWAAFQKSRMLSLWPEKATDEEKNKLSALNLDPNIHNTFVIDFLEGRVGQKRRIYGRNLSKDEFEVEVNDTGDKVTHRFSVSVYDPQDSPRTAVFKPRMIEIVSAAVKDAQFPWQYQSTLPAEKSAARLNRKYQPLPERDVYANSGLKKLCDDTGTYSASLLDIADKLRFATNCPLFRAYLLLRLGEVAQARPMSWGLPWAPAFGVHGSRIRQLVQGDLESGDWMVPEKNERLGAALDRYFQATQPISYLKQARFFHRLAEAALDAGMVFAGHVAADGQRLHLVSLDTKLDLWGLEAETRVPTRLFHWTPAEQAYQALAKAAPFTPLYALKTKPELLVQAAEQTAFVKADDPSIQPWLNPLIAGP